MLSLDAPLLIFTDLDGTLLDSHTYDWQPAAAWLARLREKNIPVILCSSKTAAEMLHIQKLLGLQGLPLIAENEWTGLSHAQASLTRLHEASVTLIWRDSDERMAEFARQLNDLGLQFVHGARFWHVLDATSGKNHAANGLIDLYRRQWKKRPITVGLGDGPNDAPLLEAMDYAVIVKGLNREGVVLRSDSTAQVYRTQHEGPEGWQEGMTWLFAAT